MLLNIWNNLRGYVQIEVTGFSVERFVNLAVNRGIYIWDINFNKNGVTMKISVKAFKNLKGISKKTRCKIKILNRNGLPFFVHSYRKRKFLALGVLFFIITLYTLSSFVWLVDITGNQTIKKDDLSLKLSEYGLSQGKFKNSIKIKDIENKLKIDFPNISFISISIKGTKALVELTEIIEKTPVVDKSIPTNIVASKDAIISNIITLRGTPLVKQKDVVKKGDVLISGALLIQENEHGKQISYVHSEGTVLGKVYNELTFHVPYIYEEKHYTGNIKNVYSLKILDKLFSFNIKNLSFANYIKNTSRTQLKLTDDYPLPIIILNDQYREFEVKQTTLDTEQCLALAERILTSRILKEFDTEVDIYEKKINYTVTDTGLDIVASITTIENIAQIEKLNIPNENIDILEN